MTLRAPAIPVILALLAITVFGCSAGRKTPASPQLATHSSAMDAPAVTLWTPCTLADAENDLSRADTDPTAALKGAACAATLLESEPGGNETRKARRTLAENACDAALIAAAVWPQSGTAHYLAGYLAGIEARLNPLAGLDLVPVIEQEALRASQLDPELDHAGPDRMLGNLYLAAPEPPVSIGDLDKALDHFTRAVELAGDFPPNRLGLAKTLAEDDEPRQACEELAAYFALTTADRDIGDAAKLLKRLCPGLD